MPRPLPHERFAPHGPHAHPRHPRPEEEATHGVLFDALMDIRERLERIEENMQRVR